MQAASEQVQHLQRGEQVQHLQLALVNRARNNQRPPLRPQVLQKVVLPQRRQVALDLFLRVAQRFEPRRFRALRVRREVLVAPHENDSARPDRQGETPLSSGGGMTKSSRRQESFSVQQAFIRV